MADIEGGELEVVRLARAEGFAAGVVEGRRQLAEEMLIRLKQFGIDLVAREHRGHAPEILAGNAAGVGSLSSPVSPAPPVSSPAAAPASLKRQRKRRPGAGQQPWRTAEREAEFRRLWRVLSFADLGRYLASLPGPPFPRSQSQSVYQWSLDLDLPKRSQAQARQFRVRTITARREAKLAVAAAFREGARVTWSEALEWAAVRAPHMVLRGSLENRLAQINEVRRAEGVGPFTLREVGVVAAA
jgi:hypothetical protein